MSVAVAANSASANDNSRQGRSKQMRRLMVQWRLRLRPQHIPRLASNKDHVTQEEMAFLCRLTHTHYGALERGRTDRGYSDATLDTVATVLRLTNSERTALYLLATGREPKPKPYAPPKITPAALAEQECQPWPVYIVSATWDVLACNTAFWKWFPHLTSETNIMRAIFCLPEVRAQLVDWEKVHAPHALALLRGSLTRLPHHEGLNRLVREILNNCPQIRAMWAADPSVWMHEDGDQRALYLPGAAEPTTVEVLSKTAMRNPDLRVTSLVPVAGHIPAECLPYVSAHQKHNQR